MADSLPDLVARLKATTPALADVPDEILTAEVARQLQARDGPSVGEAIGVPTFRTSNEKDAGGAAVVRETPSAWTKAATIGAPGLGDRYPLASVGEILASDHPLQLLAEYVTGHGRPRSVANADPLGITAFHEGKAPPPMFMGTTEEVGNVLGAAVGDVLSDAGRGLYSRVDDAVSRLPAKGAHPNKIASLLKSNGATAEELAYRQVPEFLAAKGNATVTPDALQAHLDAHPAPLPVVKTLGGGASAFRVVPTSEVATPAGLDFPPYAVVNAEGTPLSFHQTAQAAHEGIAELPAMGIHGSGPEPKFAQYQLPGGEAYQETLLTLPERGGLPEGWRTGPSSTDPGQIGVFNPAGDQVTRAATAEDAIAQAQRYSTQSGRFRSSHFDEPNILVHTRSNTRTLPTGEPGRFVEEVQSDWHQAGKDKGYSPAPGSAEAARLAAEDSAATRAHSATVRELEAAHDRVKYGTDESGALSEQLYYSKQQLRQLAETPGKPGTPERAAYLQAAAEVDRLSEALQAMQQQHLTAHEAASAANDAAYARVLDLRTKLRGGVPDAPFKETWPDLGLKQQLLEAAKDPDAQWLGFTGGQTQAARYDLSKQIDQLHWSPSSSTAGEGYLEAMKDGSPVLQKMVKAEELPGLIGKEAAKKLLDAPAVKSGYAQKALHTLEGVDLQVGGEGMHHFYDNLLPKRLQKIVKPFGGTVERSAVALAPADVVGRYAQQPEHPFIQKQQTPAWIVRLTPAMKARILKEGLPLSLLLGAAAGPSVAEALGSSVSSHDQE